MATLKVTIYKTNTGKFSLTDESYTTCNKSVMDYLNHIDPSTIGKSSNSLKNRRYRAGKTQGYRDYIADNSYEVTSEVAGEVSIEYDGRLNEFSIKSAIVKALNKGSQTIEVEPRNNASKPAHKHMAYVKGFKFNRK